MGIEDFADIVEVADAVPVDSIVEISPDALDYGSEFLTENAGDSFGQWDQVGDFAGDSNFVDATNPGSIVNDPTAIEGYGVDEVGATPLNPGATEIEGYGVPEQGAFTPPSTFEQLQSKAGAAFDSIAKQASSTLDNISKNLSKQFSPANIEKTLTGYATNLVNQAVKQTVAAVVPPALQPYTNQAINTATRSLSGAGAVSSSTRGTPGFVGPPAPLTTTASPAATNAGASFQQFDDGSSRQTFDDGSTLTIDAEGKTTSTPAPADPPVPTTQTFDDGSTLTTYPDGTTKATPAPADLDTSATPTNYGATTTTNPDGSTTQTFDDGSTLTTSPDGRITATPSPSDDPQLTLRSLANAAAQIIRTNAPGTVNDPGLATPPISTAAALAAAAALIPGGTAVTTAIADAAARAQGLLRQAQNQQTARIQSNNNAATGDWRVRLQLANASDYLYNAPDCGPLLWPLRDTDGVIFPYTPTIDTAYRANYSQYDLTHSNYRGYFYQNSYIDGINIKATFTAQDTVEANYVLACIHFFRSVTKMFYGQDAQRGTPPPMVFLSGLGDFQFNRHPCLVSQFNYNLPADVNYIRAQSTLSNGGNQLAARTRQTTLGNPISSTVQRLASLGQKIFPGAVTAPFAPQGSLAAGNPTYVPTKMEMSLVLLPVQTRSQVSQQFSLRGFANGNLLKGGFW